ncbi:NAD(P)/FAD-dependent oxidoreductase [Echinicola shivajiensis]|uniref:NAD(P)/FAD-dependent oxidoreductase n=1 Tax=Echinicola shivajiensis TaxID=1035916 RepID=UPI001BFC9005|nr:NAD(P)/FAD-dependent oxidoreductase [Echinicola shivajiensis]
MDRDNNFEVIIIGGSYAGLSAAMALGRSLRKVLIIDSGMPCNRQTPHSHNFITQDGVKPSEIAAKAKSQVLKYNTVQFLEDTAVKGEKIGESFLVNTASGKQFIANKIIFGTGIKDIMPDIKGFSDCWGISVVHCPYCHGYEIRHKKTGILANGDKAVHLASLVHNLTEELSIICSGKADFTSDQLLKFEKHQITLIEKEVAEVVHDKGQIKKVVFKDRSEEDFEALYAALPFSQHSDIPASLGCELGEDGFIKVDGMQRTNIDGVYACGDNSSGMRSVANSVAKGNVAGAVVNMELILEKF